MERDRPGRSDRVLSLTGICGTVTFVLSTANHRPGHPPFLCPRSADQSKRKLEGGWTKWRRTVWPYGASYALGAGHTIRSSDLDQDGQPCSLVLISAPPPANRTRHALEIKSRPSPRSAVCASPGSTSKTFLAPLWRARAVPAARRLRPLRCLACRAGRPAEPAIGSRLEAAAKRTRRSPNPSRRARPADILDDGHAIR